MKYRIKMMTYRTGREEFHIQAKRLGFWFPLYEYECLRDGYFPIIKDSYGAALEFLEKEISAELNTTVSETKIVFETEGK